MKTLPIKLVFELSELLWCIVRCAGYIGMGKFSNALELLDREIEIHFNALDALSGYKLKDSRILLNEAKRLTVNRYVDEAIRHLAWLSSIIIQEI